MKEWEMVIILSLVVSTVSVTITKMKIFTWLRKLAKKVHSKVGELFLCPYCLSHWVTLFFVLIYRPRIIVADFFLLDYIVTGFLIVAIANIISLVICKSIIAMESLGVHD